MTPPATRRAHIAAIRERDRAEPRLPAPMDVGRIATLAADRRYLLGVLEEAVGLLGRVAIWVGEDDPKMVRPTSIYSISRDARALLADLGPDE